MIATRSADLLLSSPDPLGPGDARPSVSDSPYGERMAIQFEATETAARVAAIDAAADRLVHGITPENTLMAFAQDWATWERYCAEVARVPATTVSSGLLVAFATWLSQPTEDRPAQSPATIVRRLTGVMDGWRRAKLDIPYGVTSDARRVASAYAKDLTRRGLPLGRGPAKALTVQDLRTVSAALPHTPAGARDRAILTLGFSIAGRRSEVAALEVSDITSHPGGLKVWVRDSKTGGRHPAVRPGSHRLTCPIRSWEAWLAESGISDGPAFRRIDRHGTLNELGMSPAAVGDVVKRAGSNAGLSHRITGHSMRAGLATEARRAGHDAKSIAKQGGWVANSGILYGYMQIVDEWSDNATEGIGL